MRFVMASEAGLTKGQPYSTRLLEVVREAQFAEEMGFDVFGVSEQHFVKTAYTVSAPEVLLGAVANATRSIQIRHLSVVALKFNHPIRIAERLATLDCLCRGRLEYGSARSNNIHYLHTFGVDPTKTRSEWRETIEVSIRALMENPFEFHGEYYDIPPTEVNPKLYRAKCPPLFVSSTSLETHHLAGKLGMGAMTFDNWFGWDYVEKCYAEYDRGLAEVEPIGGLYEPTRSKSMLAFPAHCAATREQAFAEVRPVAEGILAAVIHQYLALAEGGGQDYAYLHRMKELEKHKTNIEYVMQMSPGIMVGTPDDCIERLLQYQKLGADEVICRIDGMGHETNLRSLEMFGKHVIPHFRNPKGFASTNDWEELGIANIPKFQL